MVRYCPNCGNEVAEDDKFCIKCGKSLAVETKKITETQKSERPVSIVIAAVLMALSGLLEILLGVLVLGIGLLAQSIASMGQNIPEMPKELIGFGIIALVAIGLLILIFGIIDAAVAYGLWKLKKWAGYLGIILNVVGLFINFLFSLNNIGALIAGTFLGLLTIILIVLGWNSLE
jgi:hypothetical protein